MWRSWLVAFFFSCNVKHGVPLIDRPPLQELSTCRAVHKNRQFQSIHFKASAPSGRRIAFPLYRIEILATETFHF